jgi:hypothetical protein
MRAHPHFHIRDIACHECRWLRSVQQQLVHSPNRKGDVEDRLWQEGVL